MKDIQDLAKQLLVNGGFSSPVSTYFSSLQYFTATTSNSTGPVCLLVTEVFWLTWSESSTSPRAHPVSRRPHKNLLNIWVESRAILLSCYPWLVT